MLYNTKLIQPLHYLNITSLPLLHVKIKGNGHMSTRLHALNRWKHNEGRGPNLTEIPQISLVDKVKFELPPNIKP